MTCVDAMHIIKDGEGTAVAALLRLDSQLQCANEHNRYLQGVLKSMPEIPTKEAILPIADELYLIRVVNDIEPIIVGPFQDYAARTSEARNIRAVNGDRDGIYWLNIGSDRQLKIGAYSGSSFDD